MKKLLFILMASICLFFLNSELHSQEMPDSTTYQITTFDGNIYIGNIIKRDSSFYLLKTENLGEITLYNRDIKRVKELEKLVVKDGRYWLENPQSTRHFWSPNGYGLKKGEGYYQNVWVLFNQVAYGVTDYFSIGGGMLPLFIFAGASTPVWITPKFSIPVKKDKFNLGVGGLFGSVIGETDATFGIVYGSGTIGSRDGNISLGLGWGFAAGDWMSTPMINLAGMIRTGPRGYVISENYYIDTGDDYILLLSIGGRQIIKSVGLDYGAVVPFNNDMDSFVIVPWLGLTVPFGKK